MAKVCLALTVGTSVMFAVALLVGAMDVSPMTVARILLHKLVAVTPTWSSAEQLVVLEIRVPRILLALCVGAGLSVCGTVLQGSLRNPLVSPYLLGISSGAAFGASVVLAASPHPSVIAVRICAFGFALAGVAITFMIARAAGAPSLTTIVLAGAVTSAFFAALVALLQYFAPQERLQGLVFWTFGNLAGATSTGVLRVLPVVGAGGVLLASSGWRLNVLALGDEQAEALGVDVKRLRIFLLVVASIVTSTIVAEVGPIGWIGLIVPHLARRAVGDDHRAVLLTSVILGGLFMLCVDTLSRSVAQIEIPAGIVTAMLGVPVFVYVMNSEKRT